MWISSHFYSTSPKQTAMLPHLCTFFYSLVSWQLSTHSFKTMDLNLCGSWTLLRIWWEQWPLFSKMHRLIHTHFAFFAVISKHSEPHPQSQSNNPFSHSPSQLSSPSSPQLFICSLTRLPWCFFFLFSSKQQYLFCPHICHLGRAQRCLSAPCSPGWGWNHLLACACTCLEADAGKK